MSNQNSNTVFPDASGKIYHVKADSVSVDMFGSWNQAFELMQELGRRLGFHRVQLISIADNRKL